MTTLILGLVLFLGVHSLSIVNEPLRDRLHAALGEAAFKGLYSIIGAAVEVAFGVVGQQTPGRSGRRAGDRWSVSIVAAERWSSLFFIRLVGGLSLRSSWRGGGGITWIGGRI